MKKRSSRPLWIFWLLFFTFISAVGATLTVSELFLLANQRVVYTGIRGANIEDRRVFSVEEEAFLDGEGPVFFFGQHEVIVGTAKSITAPSPQNDVLLTKREKWETELVREILENASVRELFPANTFGILYSKKANDTFVYNDMLTLGSLIRKINKEVDASYSKIPVPYFLTLRAGAVGVN
jgi:hypothetical protein